VEDNNNKKNNADGVQYSLIMFICLGEVLLVKRGHIQTHISSSGRQNYADNERELLYLKKKMDAPADVLFSGWFGIQSISLPTPFHQLTRLLDALHSIFNSTYLVGTLYKPRQLFSFCTFMHVLCKLCYNEQSSMMSFYRQTHPQSRRALHGILLDVHVACEVSILSITVSAYLVFSLLLCSKMSPRSSIRTVLTFRPITAVVPHTIACTLSRISLPSSTSAGTISRNAERVHKLLLLMCIRSRRYALL
jgi:hypothetical protein